MEIKDFNAGQTVYILSEEKRNNPPCGYKEAKVKKVGRVYITLEGNDGLTFGMDVEASNPAFRRMKKNAYTGKVKPRGWSFEKTVKCVKAADVAAAMGEAGWLVRERYMETISWGEDGQTHYIIYEEETQ